MQANANTPRGTRILYLDDSGTPSPNHASGAVVIGGFCVASTKVPVLSRRISGAKGHYFPKRRPTHWEMKSTDLLTPNAWRRRKNRDLVLEIHRILQSLDCGTYTASIDKAKLIHSIPMRTSLPMQMQRLVEHFAVECEHRREIGLVVMDRSSDSLDAHTSRCVASFVTSRRLPLHPVVHYVDSTTSAPTQVADIISAARRRAIEGTPGMHVLDSQFASVGSMALGAKRTHAGFTWRNQIVVI